MTFGENLKNLRKQKKMTQGELADELYVSRQTISNWENNKSYPSMDLIVTMSNFFDVSVDTFIQDKISMSDDGIETGNQLTEKETIQKNKLRIVLGRLTLSRFAFAWVGSLLTTYFLTSNRHMDYISFPILLLVMGVLLSIPIEKIKKKYNLVTREDLTAFYDERYK